MASSLARSRERHVTEENLLRDALGTLIRQWFEKREFEPMRVIELLFVMGWPSR